MNILFFLIPKSEVAYIYEDETLRQAIEKMEHRKFSCIPIITRDGKYCGTIAEGDLLWGLKRLELTNIHQAEDVPIMAIPRRATYKPVHASADMEDLLDRPSTRIMFPLWMTTALLSASSPARRSSNIVTASSRSTPLRTVLPEILFPRHTAERAHGAHTKDTARNVSRSSVLSL